MRGLECQVQEGDCGDFIPLAGSRASVPLEPRVGAQPLVYQRGGRIEPNANYVRHAPSTESPHGEWTSMEVYTHGGTSVFVVNGVVNMALFDGRQSTPNGDVPLVQGKLQIQSEAAEIDYRRVRIRSIKDFPSGVQPYTLREPRAGLPATLSSTSSSLPPQD